MDYASRLMFGGRNLTIFVGWSPRRRLYMQTSSSLSTSLRPQAAHGAIVLEEAEARTHSDLNCEIPVVSTITAPVGVSCTNLPQIKITAEGLIKMGAHPALHT